MDNLVCSACEGTDKQRLRGCTSPPRVPHTDLDDRDLGWVDFTHDHFHAECDLRATAPTSTAAVRFWPFADLGGSIQVLGRVWERCPRSYMRHDLPGADPSAHRQADRAIQLWNTSKGIGLAATTALPLIPVMVDLIGICERAYAVHQAAQIAGAGDGSDAPPSDDAPPLEL